MTRWAVGERWPDEWGRKPTFPRCDGGNCKIIEAWDEEGMHEDFGYPANETIPDLYGHLIDGRWLLCEFKSSSIRNGVTQLEKGTRQMRGLCHPVSALGIVIDGFKRHDKWRRNNNGLLVVHNSKGRLYERPYTIEGMEIMVEEEGD